jgi:hypothetical protein
MQQRQRLRWLAAAAALAALSAAGCGRSRSLDDEALARQLRTMGSLSAETAFLCDELRAGHLKPSFVATHLQELRKDADKAQQEVAKPAAGMPEAQHARAQALVQQLQQSLHEVALAQAGPQEGLQRQEQALLALKTEIDALQKQ